jgi:hypothetical protein
MAKKSEYIPTAIPEPVFGEVYSYTAAYLDIWTHLQRTIVVLIYSFSAHVKQGMSS